MSRSGDSDSGDENESDGQKGLNLAGFLFGNIGEDGQLEDNFLDEASKRKLGGLNQILGLGNLIQDDDPVKIEVCILHSSFRSFSDLSSYLLVFITFLCQSYLFVFILVCC